MHKRGLCGTKWAAIVKSHVVEAATLKVYMWSACCRCRADGFMPWESVRVSLSAVVPISVSLTLGVAGLYTSFLPGTPQECPPVCFSETCLDGAKLQSGHSMMVCDYVSYGLHSRVSFPF